MLEVVDGTIPDIVDNRDSWAGFREPGLSSDDQRMILAECTMKVYTDPDDDLLYGEEAMGQVSAFDLRRRMIFHGSEGRAGNGRIDGQ